MATANCVHPHAQLQQPWAHCEQLHEHHNAHWREHCAVLNVIHACALVFGCLSVLSSPVSLLLPPVPLPALPDVHPGAWRETPWMIPCATPPSGAWSAWTMSHPSQISCWSVGYQISGCCILQWLQMEWFRLVIWQISWSWRFQCDVRLRGDWIFQFPSLMPMRRWSSMLFRNRWVREHRNPPRLQISW